MLTEAGTGNEKRSSKLFFFLLNSGFPKKVILCEKISTSEWLEKYKVLSTLIISIIN